MVNFLEKRSITPESMVPYVEGDIMVLNNVTKFQKILIKTIQLREQTQFQTVNIHKQRAISSESTVQY